jgi:hypothetical protein
VNDELVDELDQRRSGPRDEALTGKKATAVLAFLEGASIV